MSNISQISYSSLIKRSWTFITVVTLVVLLLSLILTLLQPFEYQSEVKILVIQKSAVGIDAYSASKSAERIGRNLGQIIYASAFFSQVMNAGFDIDRDYFPEDEDQRRKAWQKMIAADVAANTTILSIKVFHTDRNQAAQIARAIVFVLEQHGRDYVGVPDIDLKVVDEPLTSNLPVKPNFILNGILGLFLGLFVAVASLLISYKDAPRHSSGSRSAARDFNQPLARPEIVEPAPSKQDSRARATQAAASLPAIQLPDLGHDVDFDDDEQRAAEELPNHYSNLPEFTDEDSIKTMNK